MTIFTKVLAIHKRINKIKDIAEMLIAIQSKIMLCGKNCIITSAKSIKRVMLPNVVITLWNFVKYILKMNGCIEKSHKTPKVVTT